MITSRKDSLILKFILIKEKRKYPLSIDDFFFDVVISLLCNDDKMIKLDSVYEGYITFFFRCHTSGKYLYPLIFF